MFTSTDKDTNRVSLPQQPASDQTDSDHVSSITDEEKQDTCFPSAIEKYPLTEPHKRKLMRQLYKESIDIVMHFSRLRVGTERYLLKKETSVEILVTCVMDLDPITYPGQPSPLNEIRCAESISGVFKILVDMKIISFLQYRIVKNIITSLCKESDELREELEEYEEHFRRYIQARVFENYLFPEQDYKDSSDTVPHLVIITDETWDKHKTFVDIRDLETHVVTIFGIQDFYLDLKSIYANCVKLTYAVPNCMKELVFPLTPEQEDKLREYGVTEIHFGNYHYIMSRKGKNRTMDANSSISLLASHTGTSTSSNMEECSSYPWATTKRGTWI